MIAKIPPKRKDGQSSFRELINYICRPESSKDAGQSQPDRAIYIGTQGVSSVESAAIEMEVVAFRNVRCKDPVFHFILSWRELEFPTNEQVDEAVKVALKELDLQDCQALWALQADTENRHVHVAVNRIDPETGKAIQPAGNWTYKALERAARKIEAAQGWEIERTGRYFVEGGELKEQEKTKVFNSFLNAQPEPEARISQTARDIEAHTGAKSAERIVQEKAAPIFQAAKSWEELHEKLAGLGIAFERKGSGAVVWVKGTAVKASKINRAFSLSKLEERFGPYQERNEKAAFILNGQISEDSFEPVEKVAKEPKVKASWESYQTARREYLVMRQKANGELTARQKAERDALYLEQKKEQKRLFEISWRGKGAELNRKRSLMAAEQQKAKLNLRDRQEKERRELRKEFPSRFPNFKTWLDQESGAELHALFRYPENLVFMGDETAVGEADLRDYAPVSANKGGVAYVRRKKRKEKAAGFFGLESLIAPQADFVDYGRRILLSKNCDEAAVLAAFQLASQKWGAVWINGTEEYKRLCVAVAIKHNFKIANPDLKLAVQKGKTLEAMNTETQGARNETKQQAEEPLAGYRKLFERYAGAVDADRYRVVATEFTSDGVKAFVFDKQNGGLEGKAREEILEALPKLRAYVKYNKNICVTPISAGKHHILVDDLTQGKLRQFKDDGYSPACVIESSPGNFQAVLTMPKLGLEPEREREAANRLTKELNLKYGDPKLCGAVHAHRLPPFPNLKPKYRTVDGAYPPTGLVESGGGICPKAARQLEEISERLNRETQSWERQGTAAVSENAGNSNAAYWAHYRDIMSRLEGTPDYSAIDGKIGIRMRVTGYSAAQIYEAIKNNAPAMRKETLNAAEWSAKYNSRDWSRFAKETVEKFVFGPRGVSQYAQAEAFRAYYAQIEGRKRQAEIETKTEAKKDLGR